MIKEYGYSAIKRGVRGGWKGYYFTTATNHICHIKANKWLKFDNVSVLSLSLDNGSTYPYTLDLAGVTDIISFSKICENGTIIFAGQNKIWYSDDNLATYHESTVLNIDGNPWTYTLANDNFKSLFHHPVLTKNGVELIAFHNYTIWSPETGYVWYTIDNGHTIKMCFKKGVSLGGFDFRHIDALNYDPVHSTSTDEWFWMMTGDGGYISWNTGVYNWAADTWTWTQIVADEQRHASGISFNGDTFYWGDDTGGARLGNWKCPYAQITDTSGTYWTKVETCLTKQSSFFDAGDGLILSHDSGLWTRFHYSLDHGETWSYQGLTGGPAIEHNGWIFCPIGPDNNFWYRYEIQENYPTPTYAEDSWKSTMGIVLMVQIYPNKGSE